MDGYCGHYIFGIDRAFVAKVSSGLEYEEIQFS
ncbi:hypothetical protein SDC9_177940 [bioreactor metagenome]|uniref:Uncharacterized protein n=1 Tax=bioreactor metagenome TaxID=1076179 RepID=A0A645GXH8_9ZZZZ